MTHSYGSHDPSTAPTETPTGLPLHPDVMAQRKQLNDIAAGKSSVLSAVNAAAPDVVKARIDAAILRVAARGGVFSANEVRPLVPDAPGPLMGARFNAAAKRGLIRRVGYVPSTKGNTHSHPIAEWSAA